MFGAKVKHAKSTRATYCGKIQGFHNEWNVESEERKENGKAREISKVRLSYILDVVLWI